MTDQEDFEIWISEKNAKIISEISNMHGISLDAATEMYYNSDTAQLIHDRIADLHCRSEKYLAEEVWAEKSGKKQ